MDVGSVVFMGFVGAHAKAAASDADASQVIIVDLDGALSICGFGYIYYSIDIRSCREVIVYDTATTRVGTISAETQGFTGCYLKIFNDKMSNVELGDTIEHEECTLPIQGMRSIISTVSISPEGFLPSILLLVVIIGTVVIVVVTVILVVVVVTVIGVVIVVTIIGVVGVVVVSSIIKLS
ncbi:hypothetical protein Tco_0309094 [Tanacetum coccineum]